MCRGRVNVTLVDNHFRLLASATDSFLFPPDCYPNPRVIFYVKHYDRYMDVTATAVFALHCLNVLLHTFYSTNGNTRCLDPVVMSGCGLNGNALICSHSFTTCFYLGEV